MANWLDKISQAADKVANVVSDAASKTVKTYQEKGIDGIVEKTGEILVKTGDTLEKKAVIVNDKTQNYLRNIGESNKEVIDEVEKNVGKGTFSAKLAAGLAVTANTTQTMAEDLAGVTKNAYQKLVVSAPVEALTRSVKDTVKEARQSLNAPSAEEVFAALDAIPLEKVLKEVIRAELVNNKWVDASGNSYIVFANSWYQPTSRVGDKNAVSLTSYHLAQLSKLDYNDPQQKAALQQEAINVLKSYEFVPHIKLDLELVDDKASENKTEKKAQVKSKTPQKAEADVVTKTAKVKAKATVTTEITNKVDKAVQVIDKTKPVKVAKDDTIAAKAKKPVAKKVTVASKKTVDTDGVAKAPVKTKKVASRNKVIKPSSSVLNEVEVAPKKRNKP